MVAQKLLRMYGAIRERELCPSLNKSITKWSYCYMLFHSYFIFFLSKSPLIEHTRSTGSEPPTNTSTTAKPVRYNRK